MWCSPLFHTVSTCTNRLLTVLTVQVLRSLYQRVLAECPRKFARQAVSTPCFVLRRQFPLVQQSHCLTVVLMFTWRSPQNFEAHNSQNRAAKWSQTSVPSSGSPTKKYDVIMVVTLGNRTLFFVLRTAQAANVLYVLKDTVF